MGTNPDDLTDHQVKHLELIQGVINRMGGNSFAVKTWAVGLNAAIFALAAERPASHRLLVVPLLPVAVFWYLDAFYLRQERLFRHLYNAVRRNAESVMTAGPFGMSTRPFEDEPDTNFWAVAWSPTIRWLYVLLIVIVGLVLLATLPHGRT
jgi:hypothetical protein